MQRRTEDEPIPVLQKRIERQKIKTRNQKNQQRDNLLPDAIGLEEDIYQKGKVIEHT